MSGRSRGKARAAELEADARALTLLVFVRNAGHAPELELSVIVNGTGLSTWRARGALARLRGRGLIGRRRVGRNEGRGRSFLVWRVLPSSPSPPPPSPPGWLRPPDPPQSARS